MPSNESRIYYVQLVQHFQSVMNVLVKTPLITCEIQTQKITIIIILLYFLFHLNMRSL